MQSHQTLHASTSRNGAVPYLGHYDLLFHISCHIKGKSCLGHILNNHFMHDHQT